MPISFWTVVLLGGASMVVFILGNFPKSDAPNQLLSFIASIVLFALYIWSSIKTVAYFKKKQREDSIDP